MPVIKQRTQFTNSPIGVSSFDTGADAVYQAVSNFASQVGKIAIEEGNRAAVKRGEEEAQALTPEEVVERSKNKPKSALLPKIQDEAFNQVVDRRFVDTISKDIQLESKRIAQKYEDPVSYERVFGNYLRDMTEGADERFQGIVANVAKYTMADTKLNLAAAARTKARAASAQGTLATNGDFSEEAFNQSVQGNHLASVSMIEERKLAMQEGIAADLFKEGADTAVVNQIATSALKGAVNIMLPYVNTVEEQVAITTYIATNGRAVSPFISKENLEVLEMYKPYMNTQTTGPIITEMNGINSRINAVRREQQAAADAEAELRKRAALQAFVDVQDGSDMSNKAMGGYSAQTPNLAEASAAFRSMEVEVEDRISSIKDAFTTGAISTLEQRDKLIDEAVKSALDSQLIAVISKDPSEQGIESVKAFLANPNQNTFAAINNKSQRYLAKALVYGANPEDGTGIYENEYRDYSRNFMDDMKNNTQEKIDNEIFKANLAQDITDLSGQFNSGSVDIDMAGSVVKDVEEALKSGRINASEFTAYTEALGGAQAKGMVNLVSGAAGTRASDLSALALFIDSNGQDKTGLTPEMEVAGNALRANLPDSQVKTVVRHINSLRERKSSNEKLIQKEAEKRALTMKVANGNGDPTKKDNRETADDVLKEQFGLSGITDPRAKDPRVLAVLRSTPSQELVDSLNSMATGFDTFTDEEANNLMDLFSILSNDATDTGVFVNRFGDLLGGNLAELTEIQKIRKRTGRSSREIAMTLAERRDDPVSKERVKDIFGKLTPAEYIASTGLFSEYGMSVGRELGPAAKYYIQIGYSEEDMVEKVKQLADGKFTKSDIVVDPRFPVGKQNKTMESLEAMYPDKDRRNYFVEQIASQLPEGYMLANTNQYATPDAEGGAARKKRRGIEKSEDKLVYLVPSETGVRGSYYAYFVDENNELRPLITERNNEPYWPLFDDSELETYDMYQSIKGDVDAEQRLSEAGESLEFAKDLRSKADTYFPSGVRAVERAGDIVDAISSGLTPTTATSSGRKQ